MKVTQVKSKNGSNQRQIDTLRSLGLRRIGHTVEVKDNPQSRGMLHRVRHLVKVAEASSARGSTLSMTRYGPPTKMSLSTFFRAR